LESDCLKVAIDKSYKNYIVAPMKLFGSNGFLATATTLSVLFVSFLVVNSLLAVDYASTARGVDVFLLTSVSTPESSHLKTDIVFTNDNTPLNVMEAEVLFDPSMVEVTDFIFGSSLCEERFIIDYNIDNEVGRLHVSCGTTQPFGGTIGIFGTIQSRPLQTGVTQFSFGEKTHVYVHDGHGTEIVRDTYATTVTLATDV